MRIRLDTLIAFVTAVVATSAAQGALFDRGGGLIYDDVLKITWLQNANLGAGSSYDDGRSSTDGIMSWQKAVDWASNLSYYDGLRGVHYDDWRLPHALPVNGANYAYDISYDGSTDRGLNIISTQSELSYMFYVNFENLGSRDTAGNVLSGAGLNDDPTNPQDESLFADIGSAYWTGTPYNGSDASGVPFAWNFNMDGGLQSRAFIPGADHFAWAVRDGDVQAAPEPATVALISMALLGVVAARTRKTPRRS